MPVISASGQQRKTYSRARLDELRARLSEASALLEPGGLCVYATGSYGRLEAWSGSDIDLFFLYRDGQAASALAFIQIAARLIEMTDEMGFPPFSGDGRYLESLNVSTMEEKLGSPEDDHTNAFTARMLLLLESQPVSDGDRYAELLEQIVGFYYRDLKDHERDFVPTFLTNDILRFWRTLTLNYEHDRLKARSRRDEVERARTRSKSSLKNYKLKHSRLATCFSMVAHLASATPPVLMDQVVDLCRMTPQERFEALRGTSAEVDRVVEDVCDRYEEFLRCVQRPDAELLAEFADATQRRVRLQDAARYGDAIFELLTLLVPHERMRHLVI